MSLIAILVSLVLERTMTGWREFRRFDWFDRYTDKIRKGCEARGWQGVVSVALIMLGPVIVVALLNLLFDDHLLGLLSLLFSTAVLFLCLGPRDLDEQVDAFLDAWDREDEEAARAAAQELLGEQPPESLTELHQQMVQHILVAATERVLAPIFMFTVFFALGSGPLGAVLYRLGCHLNERFANQADDFGRAVQRLYAILGWAPAHVVALLFAMAGSFVDTIQLWRERSHEWRKDWQLAATAVVLTGGIGALQLHMAEAEVSSEDIPQHVRAAMGLVLRSLVILVVLIALLTVLVLLAG